MAPAHSAAVATCGQKGQRRRELPRGGRHGPGLAAALLAAAAGSAAVRRGTRPWRETVVGSRRVLCPYSYGDRSRHLPSRAFILRDEPARKEESGEEPSRAEPELLSSGSDGVGVRAVLRGTHDGVVEAWRPSEQASSGVADVVCKAVLWASFVLASAGSASLLVYAVMSGLLLPTSGGGLRPSTLIKHMKAVRYEPALFADPADEADQRPAAECCCCSEAYTAGTRIMRTPCDHYFHQECLARWLAIHPTCPLCRSDLEVVASEPDTVDVL